jgi:pyrroline-5-carboxylate reductase
MSMIESLTFFGGGHMACALMGGVQQAKQAPKALRLVDPDSRVRQVWTERFGAVCFSCPEEAACQSAYWVLAVKPQHMRDLCVSIAAQTMRLDPGHRRPEHPDSHGVISVAAGVRIASLAQWLGDSNRYIRCMPNTPALIGRGVTALYADLPSNHPDKTIAQSIMDCVGKSLWLTREEDMDAVTAVSGSGPAYVFRMIEAMQDAALALGLSAEDSRLLVIETLRGASELAHQSTLAPAQLREQVTSKGGTTAAALAVFEAEDFGGLIKRALSGAAARSAELARHNEA